MSDAEEKKRRAGLFLVCQQYDANKKYNKIGFAFF